ncbi:MAG TPA: hypothetical protein VMM76_23780 [Pirellulaceae bacterium]|nr:hypothetical protein [Pirellulaceae bacterium]
MESSRVLTLILLSGGLGFGGYCVACALHVWKARIAGSGNHAGASRCTRRLKGIGVALIAGGALTATVGLIVQLFLNREGVLRGEQLTTIRPPETLLVQEVTSAETVRAADWIATFRSPEREAQIEVNELKLENHAAQQRVLRSEPLKPDAEITRHLQEALAEQRHLQMTLSELELEDRRLNRERLRDQLAREKEIGELGEKIGSLESELKQAEADREYQAASLSRLISIRRRDEAVIPDDQYEQLRSEARIAEEEVLRLQESVRAFEAERAKQKHRLHELLTVAEQQSTEYQTRIVGLRERLAAVSQQHESLQRQLDSDLVRAREHRQEQLGQLGIALQQTERELAGLKDSITIRAPRAGRIVYRDPSPQTVKPGEPLLVFSPDAGLRVRLRLPTWEARLLAGAGPVRLQLIEPETEQGKVQQRFIERRFLGSWASSASLPQDRGFALVELSCEPPGDAIRSLAAGDEIAVRMIWLAPLYRNPLVHWGALLAALGACGITTTVVLSRKVESGSHARERLSVHNSTRRGPPPLVSSEDAMLHLLGSQLREAIVRGEVDPSLIAAAEWALDGHRPRAIRLMALGLGEDAEFLQYVENCWKQLSAEEPADEFRGANCGNTNALQQRTAAVLRPIASESLRRRLHFIERQWDELAVSRQRIDEAAAIKASEFMSASAAALRSHGTDRSSRTA